MRLVAASLVCVAALVAAEAHAQAHQSTDGVYTLRSSTVSSQSIAPSVARAHNFTPGPAVAILNVTVIEKGQPANGTTTAAISVTARDLAGRAQTVEMKEDRENGYVSYYGTYRHLRNETLTFDIMARPEGTEKRLVLHYRDRIGRR